LKKRDFSVNFVKILHNYPYKSLHTNNKIRNQQLTETNAQAPSPSSLLDSNNKSNLLGEGYGMERGEAKYVIFFSLGRKKTKDAR